VAEPSRLCFLLELRWDAAATMTQFIPKGEFEVCNDAML